MNPGVQAITASVAMSFAIAGDVATVSYSVDGVSVTKTVQPFTWRFSEIAGSYRAAIVTAATGAVEDANVDIDLNGHKRDLEFDNASTSGDHDVSNNRTYRRYRSVNCLHGQLAQDQPEHIQRRIGYAGDG